MSDYKADLFVMIPFTTINNKIIKNGTISNVQTCDEADIFIKQLEKNSKYECSDSISSKVNRKFIGAYEFMCISDSSNEEQIIETENCYLFLTSHENTNLHIVTIMIIDVKSPVTFVLDQVSREDLIIKVNNQKIKLYDFFINEFNFQVCGKAKTCISLSDYPNDEKEMLYLAAGEAFGSDEVDFELMSKQFKSDVSKNIAQFDFCDIYASKTNIIQINKRFTEKFCERIYYETLLIFIAELVIFKELAIHRTNQKVVREIEKNSKPSLKLIERLSIEFGSTIGLWNISNFRYNAVQCLAKDIEDSFQISELMLIYNNNQNYLEHIINIRNIQVSEWEGKILNFIAIMLTLIQTIPLILSVFTKISIFKNIKFDWKYGAMGLITILLIILIRKRKMSTLIK
ncbi:hypothetical protein K2F43_08280 [Clostridium estertheticum]|uniref:hypothetical protein n=1 Tax=Clostridium estertheticum TaxID=238834 RepID=UPI001C6E923B|nr:hypothetical protein [Clostridium estertheticum]MBW9171204.1 hypothetical protein [Clostridium estertheticum]WLC73938.1 hypothetical protein KTC99_14255 [Clostridium estertheticum]